MNKPYTRIIMCVVIMVALGLSPALAQQTPKRGGTLQWWNYADPARLDIHTESALTVAQAVSGIYSGLVQWGPVEPEKVSPDLAERWETSSDGTVYTFHLRQGVKWHDGQPFSAADALHSLKRVLDPEVRSPRCGSLLRPLVDSVEAPDAMTIVIRTKFTTAILLPALASTWCKILPKHILERDGDMTNAASQIGTGPFKLAKYVRGSVIEWERNPDYFVKGWPYLDGVKQYILKSRPTQVAAFKAGKTDFWHLAGLHKTHIEEIKTARQDIQYTEQPAGSITQLHMNSQKPPFDNPEMRRALHLAIDRQAMVDKVYDGHMIPCVILDPVLFGEYALPVEEVQQMPGCRQPKEADIAEAKRLVAKHYPDGLDLEVSTRSLPVYLDAATLLVPQLAQIGIRATVKTYESAAGFTAWARGEFSIIAAQTTAMTFMDPSAPFTLVYTAQSPRNYGKLSIPGLDELYEKGLRELDPAKRKAIYREYQRKILTSDTATVTFGWGRTPYMVAQKMRGWSRGPTPYDNLTFQNVWLAQ